MTGTVIEVVQRAAHVSTSVCAASARLPRRDASRARPRLHRPRDRGEDHRTRQNRNNVVLSRRAWPEQTQSEVRRLPAPCRRARCVPALSPPSSTPAPSIWAGWTVWFTSPVSWKYIDRPSEVVEVGNESVEVFDVDMDRSASPVAKATRKTRGGHCPHARHRQVCPARSPACPLRVVQVRAASKVSCTSRAGSASSSCRTRSSGRRRGLRQGRDIDLERRHSRCPKRANEGVDPNSDEFDPSLYGMAAEVRLQNTPGLRSRPRSGWKASTLNASMGGRRRGSGPTRLEQGPRRGRRSGSLIEERDSYSTRSTAGHLARAG